MKQCSLFSIAVYAAMLLLLPASVQAQDEEGGVKFSGSGFLTLAAGKILGGDAPQNFNGFQAPMFVSDYGQGGVYENNGWSIKPDSKLGLQGTATFNPQFSLTGQIVSRGAKNGKLDLEWAYGNYNFNDNLSLQLGRKRLPLFYYSETQDVGFTYPWVHLPPGQYGWEIVNFNGANLRYQTQWGAWSSSMEVFAGAETQTDNGFWKIYNGKNTHTDSKWSNIVGADLTLTRDWFDSRVAYIQSDMQDRLLPADFGQKAKQKIYTLSFSIDQQHWVVRNEYLYIDRKPIGEEDYSLLLGVGYRIGKFLPMVTYNKYKIRLTPAYADPGIIDPTTIDPLAIEAWSTLALSLSYALTPTSDIKVQLDQWKDQNGPNFNGGIPYGNARLLSVSYDMVF